MTLIDCSPLYSGGPMVVVLGAITGARPETHNGEPGWAVFTGGDRPVAWVSELVMTRIRAGQRA